jgi:hypothetical protein
MEVEGSLDISNLVSGDVDTSITCTKDYTYTVLLIVLTVQQIWPC